MLICYAISTNCNSNTDLTGRKSQNNNNKIFVEMKTRKLVTHAVMLVLFFVVSANAYAQENNSADNPFALLDSSRFDIVPNSHLGHAAKSIHFGPAKSVNIKANGKIKRVVKKKKCNTKNSCTISTNATYYIFSSNDTSGFYFGSLKTSDSALYAKYLPISEDDNSMCFTLTECRAPELADSIKSNLEKGYLVSVKSDGTGTATYKLFKVDNNTPLPNNTKTTGLFFGIMTFADEDDRFEFMMEKAESGYIVATIFNKEDNSCTLVYRAK